MTKPPSRPNAAVAPKRATAAVPATREMPAPTPPARAPSASRSFNATLRRIHADIDEAHRNLDGL